MLLIKFRHYTDDVNMDLLLHIVPQYCCSVWSSYDNSTTLRSIHVAHNVVLRFKFHLPWYTMVSNIF